MKLQDQKKKKGVIIMTTFKTVKEKNFKRLEQFTPIVARVHGGSHPEFHQVKDLWDKIRDKTESAGDQKPALDNEFSQLRQVTENYTVPEDTCESYEAVYKMLEEVDQAYYA